MATIPNINEKELTDNERKFIELIKQLPDKRDNRGKRHRLDFVVIAVIFAMLSRCSMVSRIHRFIKNKIEWLREVTGIDAGKPVSRAHLPRMLANMDWDDLNLLIYECFGTRILRFMETNEWIAVDGKALRGSLKSGEKQAIVHAVSHNSRIDIAQARMTGEKSSEITVVREFIKETGLEKHKLTLDAHHCNPETTAQINQAGGSYLIQVKENQPILLKQCKALAQRGEVITENETVDADHGRIVTRRAKLFSMKSIQLDTRWNPSNIETLIMVHRETFDNLKKTTTQEDSYYICNQTVESASAGQKLAEAVRYHWGVESNNWILDVNFNEDKVRVKHGNQSQIMGKLRALATNLVRWTGAKNLSAKIDEFVDVPEALILACKQINFL